MGAYSYPQYQAPLIDQHKSVLKPPSIHFPASLQEVLMSYQNPQLSVPARQGSFQVLNINIIESRVCLLHSFFITFHVFAVNNFAFQILLAFFLSL
jgi:hypothetical protein